MSDPVDRSQVEVDPESSGRRGDTPPLRTLPDDGRGDHVPGFKFIDETAAQEVVHAGTRSADSLGDQHPGHFGGKDDTGGMVLEAVDMNKLCPHAVGHAQTVTRGAEMIGGGKASKVQPAGSPGGENDRAPLHENVLPAVEIPENRTGTGASRTLPEFNRRRKLEDLHGRIDDIFLQHPDQLESGIVLGRNQSGTRRPPAFAEREVALGIPVEKDSPGNKPFHHPGPFRNKNRKQRRVILAMPPPEGVPEMFDGTVSLSQGRLDPPFGHDRVGIADPKFCREKNADPLLCRIQGRGDSRSSPSDNEDIDLPVGMVRNDPRPLETASRLEKSGDLFGNNGSGVRTDPEGRLAFGPVVGIVGLEKSLTIFG